MSAIAGIEANTARIIRLIATKQLPLAQNDLRAVKSFCAQMRGEDREPFVVLPNGISPRLRTDWLDTSLDPVVRACQHTHVNPLEWRNLMELECARTVLRFLRDSKIQPRNIAGLLMWRGALAYLKVLAKYGFRVCHMDAKRNEQTLEITTPMPMCLEDQDMFRARKYDAVIIPDPMLASGSSTAFAIDILKGFGVRNTEITVLCVVAAPEGVFRLLNTYPGIKIVAAVLDGMLNEHAYIVEQGLGDAGDKYFYWNLLSSFELLSHMFNRDQWSHLEHLFTQAPSPR